MDGTTDSTIGDLPSILQIQTFREMRDLGGSVARIPKIKIMKKNSQTIHLYWVLRMMLSNYVEKLDLSFCWVYIRKRMIRLPRFLIQLVMKCLMSLLRMNKINCENSILEKIRENSRLGTFWLLTTSIWQEKLWKFFTWKNSWKCGGFVI